MMLVITSTGWPFNMVGLYFHWRTASLAALTSSGCPRTSCKFSMLPSLLIVAVNSTVPDTRADFASGGYTGGTLRIRLASATCPPTRTGPEGALAAGGGGGGGAPGTPP